MPLNASRERSYLRERLYGHINLVHLCTYCDYTLDGRFRQKEGIGERGKGLTDYAVLSEIDGHSFRTHTVKRSTRQSTNQPISYGPRLFGGVLYSCKVMNDIALNLNSTIHFCKKVVIRAKSSRLGSYVPFRHSLSFPPYRIQVAVCSVVRLFLRYLLGGRA